MFELLNQRPQLAATLRQELDGVIEIFEQQLASEIPAVSELCVHINRYRGKMLRPTLLLVSSLGCYGSAEMNAHKISKKHRIVAAVTEMIHMATLVHDDVLDLAQMRRNGSTINDQNGNQTAVMFGDYLISNAFHLCSHAGDPDINLRLGEVTNTLCEGEIIQLNHRDDMTLSEETYFQIISKKTASLIGACCELGAILANAEDNVVKAMRQFGCSLGIAFQIKDDLLDFMGEQELLGKKPGKDIDAGEFTLPLIDYFSHASESKNKQMLEHLKVGDATAVHSELLASRSLDRSMEKAASFVQQAKDQLSVLEDSDARVLLSEIADQVIVRTS